MPDDTRGTAMAERIWATAAIGVAVGLRSYDTAIVLSIVTFATPKVRTNFKSPRNEALTPLEKEGNSVMDCGSGRAANPKLRDPETPAATSKNVY
ncbi:MgtC/SapB family protein (plasmid) [Ensifer sp. PDNC004]|uniref:MgtC/SapB family protein n=1 Tax=Ensifer sp. PDNC004 TaxID=2811423 RepID=UPI001964830F|nr:MgtC/SapB family protein [Ensifer sp. PDNC004]